jgi:hypothetical protein
MENLIKFLLTEWKGAPLAMWFAGMTAVLVMFIVWKSTWIRVKPFRGEIEIENKPPAKRKPKKPPPDATPKPT